MTSFRASSPLGGEPKNWRERESSSLKRFAGVAGVEFWFRRAPVPPNPSCSWHLMNLLQWTKKGTARFRLWRIYQVAGDCIFFNYVKLSKSNFECFSWVNCGTFSRTFLVRFCTTSCCWLWRYRSCVLDLFASHGLACLAEKRLTTDERASQHVPLLNIAVLVSWL